MQAERKNLRVRKTMAESGINQTMLARIMGISEMECSIMLKRELAKVEQDDIIKAIKDSIS